MRAVFVVVLGLFLTIRIQAGEIGNGGHVVVCIAPGGKSVEVLDLYEALKAGLELDFGNPLWSAQQKVDHVLNRLDRFDPDRSQRLKAAARNFLSESRFLDNIPQTQDHGEVEIPSSCHLEQLAVQYPPQFPGDTRYVIEQSLWEKLDSTQQAVLILHEVIYGDAIANGIGGNSKRSRSFVIWLASTRSEQATVDEYHDLVVKKLRLGIFRLISYFSGYSRMFRRRGKSLYWGSYTLFPRTFQIQRFNPQVDRAPVVVFSTPMEKHTFWAVSESGHLLWTKRIIVQKSPEQWRLDLYVTSPFGTTDRLAELPLNARIDMYTAQVVGDRFTFTTESGWKFKIWNLDYRNIQPAKPLPVEETVQLQGVDENFVYYIVPTEGSQERSLFKWNLKTNKSKLIRKSTGTYQYFIHNGDAYFSQYPDTKTIYRIRAGTSNPKKFWVSNYSFINVDLSGDHLYWRSYAMSDGTYTLVRKSLVSSEPEHTIELLSGPVDFFEATENYLYVGRAGFIRQYNTDWFNKL